MNEDIIIENLSNLDFLLKNKKAIAEAKVPFYLKKLVKAKLLRDKKGSRLYLQELFEKTAKKAKSSKFQSDFKKYGGYPVSDTDIINVCEGGQSIINSSSDEELDKMDLIEILYAVPDWCDSMGYPRPDADILASLRGEMERNVALV